MGLRRGADYLASLDDGREVWLRGERVDVASHPSLAACARTFAAIYDLQHDPACRDLLTMPSPTSGQLVSLSYLPPRSVADLTRKREMMEFLMRRTGAALGRLPQHAATIVLGLYDVRDTLAAEHPRFALNAAAFYERCRENDLAICLAFNEPQRDSGRPAAEMEPLHVVEERLDGVVVRGARGVATAAPYADEVLVLTLPRAGLRPEEVVYLACPLDAPGLKVICREPLAPRYPDSHPLAAGYDEMDAWLVFDDVFVPHERVFYRRQTEGLAQLFGQILAWAYPYGIVRMAVKAEVLAGVAAAVADYLSIGAQPHVQTGLADALCYVEILRALVREAERAAIPTPGGLLAPNPLQINVGRIYSVEQEPPVLQILRQLCGSGILMAPSEADLASADIGAHVQRYVAGPDERAPDRYRLLRLAWDYAADSFGARQLLFDMYNTAELHTNKARLARDYDTASLTALARELAGIGQPTRV
jgi:4-hydroxyphenylacetate 3-monooxygenase